MSLAISVIGATGRMGRKILEKAICDPEIKLVGGCASRHSLFVGTDLGHLIPGEALGVPLEADKDATVKKSDVVIDFSLHHATSDNLQSALKHLKPIVIGSTGHSSEQKRTIEAAAKFIPVLFSPNFSLGMGLCFQAARLFAKHLKGRCHIDIVEIHHHQKKDIPSGTALALAQALNYGYVCQDMSIPSPRPKEAVFIHSIRSAETVGEHTLIFNCEGERIELKHQIFSRDAFATGALKAAKFLSKKPPGLYTYQEVFNEE